MPESFSISSSQSTSFITKRINPTTYLIIEDDSYSEQPHIYIKIYPNHLLLTDTGCNSSRTPNLTITSLRQHLETFPLPQNNNRPLNPHGLKRYIIICTHCHYDHILGLSPFLSSKPEPEPEPIIIASSHSKSFITTDLPTHSLCKYIPVPTPQYSITHWASHLSNFTLPLAAYPFRVQFLHIPGHTPDSLAWYDIDEYHLYIGDTFYERKRQIPIPELPDDDEEGKVKGGMDMKGAIQFPNEGGNWIHYMSSLSLLLSFVNHQNKLLKRQHELSPHNTLQTESPRVNLSTGHITFSADAEQMIIEVKSFFERIIAGNIPVAGSLVKRGAVYDFWLEKEGGEVSKFSVLAPRRLCEEAKRVFHPERDGR
jgi:glyoxylase-like metal-dependent hydrolase (beta-lactamase superfamily II)